MTRVRAVTFAACAAALGFAVLVRADERSAGVHAQKPSREAIFELQNKNDQPGSPDAGRPIFEKLCASCHRFGELGKEMGPDLTTLASRFKKRDILESILWPSKLISDQYQAQMFELSDGKIVTGMLVRETATAVLVRTAESPDKPVAIQKSTITTRAQSTVSVMPEALVDDLSQADITNLLAFLLSKPPGPPGPPGL